MRLQNDEQNKEDDLKKRLFAGLGISLVLLSSCGALNDAKEQIKDSLKEEQQTVTVQEKPKFEDRLVKVAYISVLSDGLNVRTEPDEDGSFLIRVPKESKYTVLDTALDSKKRTWYQVEYQTDKTGWVAGWHVAETEITILVREEDTVIQSIDAKEPPVYLENPFNPAKAKVGHRFYGLTIVEKTENGIRFTGDSLLTGNYRLDKSGKFYYFTPNEASAVSLPRIKQNIHAADFIIYEIPATPIFEGESAGEATIRITEYELNYNGENIVQLKRE